MGRMTRRTYSLLCVLILAVLIAIGASVVPVQAGRGHGYARDRYYSPHWELDLRHGHEYYYPARGYIVPSLPPGYLESRFGGGRFFFRSGVWYRARGPQFVVVSPPVGIRLGLLPPVYSIIWVGGVPYYYANGIYYTPVPNSSDYVVVNPPVGYESAASEPPPAQASAPTPVAPVNPQSNPAMVPPQALFIYPREGQTQSEITADRLECNDRATGQTGYDPAHPGTGSLQRAGDFQRTIRTCLEGKGYTVN